MYMYMMYVIESFSLQCRQHYIHVQYTCQLVNLSYCIYIHSASERVSVVSEYQSRQKAAMDNKRKAEGKGGFKYQPPHGRGQPHPRKNKAEQVKGCEFTMYVLIFLSVLVYMYIIIHFTCFVVSITTGISS